MKKLRFILVALLLSTLLSCGQHSNDKKTLVKIYFVPNIMTTLNKSTITFNTEYDDYGMYVEFKDEKFLESLNSIIKNSNDKSDGTPAMRIKVVTEDETIYLSYLPKAAIFINNSGFNGSPKLLNLVVSKLLEHYENGDFVCEGTKCLKEVKQENIAFFNKIIDKTSL